MKEYASSKVNLDHPLGASGIVDSASHKTPGHDSKAAGFTKGYTPARSSSYKGYLFPVQLRSGYTNDPLFDFIHRKLLLYGLEPMSVLPFADYWLAFLLFSLPSLELGISVAIKEITQQLNFYYKEKSLQILLANNISEKNASAGYMHRYELIILYNGFCVLRNSDRVSGNKFLDYTLKSFKNGSWMDDLDYIRVHFEWNRWNKNKTERNEKLKTIADKLDLNRLDLI